MEYYSHPFMNVQSNGSESFIFLSSDPSRCIRIYNPNHPLYGIQKERDLLDRFNLLSKTDRDVLSMRGFVSDTGFDRNMILKGIADIANAPENLNITLLPTLNCNNKCPYCYQEHQHQPQMNIHEYEAIYKLICHKLTEGVKVIHLSLMGGEPTLESGNLIPFIERCHEFCEKHGAVFYGTMSSNGRLLACDSVAKKFVDSGITNFQITLDGVPEIHNKTRPGINGEATFDETLNAILALRDNGGQSVSCSIRTNHTFRSIKEEYLSGYLSFLSNHIGRDRRFNVYHHFASDLGGIPDSSDFVPKEKRSEILEHINELTQQYGLFLKTDIYGPNGRVCYAAKRNSIAVLPGLKLVKCTTALYEPSNQVGTLSSDGILELNDNFEKWTDWKVTEKAKCNSCKVAPICHAQTCPLERIKKGEPPCPDVKYSKSFFFRIMRNESFAQNMSS